MQQLDYLGLTPHDIVIEITEGSSIKDFGRLRETVDQYSDMGFAIALDDMGEGFSGLRLWSEISPD